MISVERVLDCLKKYSHNISILERLENFETYILTLEIANLTTSLEWKDISFFASFVNERDAVSLSISVNEGDPFSFNLKDDSNLIPLFENVNTIIDEESIVTLTYRVDKEKVDSTISIYELDIFTNFLSSQKLLFLLNHLHKNIDLSSQNKFEVLNDASEKIYFQNSIIFFASGNRILETYDLINNETRKIVLKNRTLNTNPQNFSKYSFIPNDFSGTYEGEPTNIFNLFHKLKVVFAASYLANISNIKSNNNTIQLGIIGHNYLEVTSDYKNLNYSFANSFYEIYKWVYMNADINDRLDLARNIITRYFKFDQDKWNLPLDTLSSIQSAHAIYLKENVEKYIETKNKVAEITTELSVKSKDVADYFIATFKNNNLTLLTYFISIFIFNSLSDNSDKKIFSEEKYYLSMVFLLISTLYLLFTRKQFYRDLKVTVRYFYSIKRIYRDIFDKNELNNLFNKRHLQYNVKNITQTVNRFSWIWLIEILLLYVSSIYFTYFL